MATEDLLNVPMYRRDTLRIVRKKLYTQLAAKYVPLEALDLITNLSVGENLKPTDRLVKQFQEWIDGYKVAHPEEGDQTKQLIERYYFHLNQMKFDFGMEAENAPAYLPHGSVDNIQQAMESNAANIRHVHSADDVHDLHETDPERNERYHEEEEEEGEKENETHHQEELADEEEDEGKEDIEMEQPIPSQPSRASSAIDSPSFPIFLQSMPAAPATLQSTIPLLQPQQPIMNHTNPALIAALLSSQKQAGSKKRTTRGLRIPTAIKKARHQEESDEEQNETSSEEEEETSSEEEEGTSSGDEEDEES